MEHTHYTFSGASGFNEANSLSDLCPVTKSTFAPRRTTKTVPLTQSDSDISVIIKNDDRTIYEKDPIFFEENSTREAMLMVKKSLRPKRKRIGSMPVCSDPELEQSSSLSDVTFIGRPSVSSLTPDLTVSRMAYGLPDNSSTPFTKQRSKGSGSYHLQDGFETGG
jgi:hypothetical protein